MSNRPSYEDQTYLTPPSVTPAADPFSWAALIVTIIVFLLVLYFVFWLVRRINRQGFRGGTAPWLRVLDRQILAGQQSLYLVEIAGKIQVLGATDHHLNCIAEIDDPELAAEILEEIAERPEDQIDRLLGFLTPKRAQQKKKAENFSAELERLLQNEEDKV